MPVEYIFFKLIEYSSSRKSISKYDYEIIENEKKRSIVLIEDVYAKQILEESRKIYNEWR